MPVFDVSSDYDCFENLVHVPELHGLVENMPGK